MFKKKPNIKTLSPLRSSDRRKIADQLIKEYKIEVPSDAPPPPQPPADGEENANENGAPSSNQTQANLTAIRNSLLPESALSARFTTTVGPDLREVQGTVYAGTHPEAPAEERILWFKLEQGPGADGRLYPTVYTLWHNPHLVPLLHTPSLVMNKLFGGADLMTPGLANGPPFPAGATKGAVVAVARLDKPTVPQFVGVCEIDVAALGEVQGVKGHAVRGVHWEGDELWAWSSASRPGQAAPEYLEGWDNQVEDIEAGVDEIKLTEEESGVPSQPQEGVPVGEAPEREQDDAPTEPENEPTTKEIDEAFVKAFIYSLYKLKQGNPTTPNHGISFPIQPSALISSFVTPYLPIYTPKQAQYYQIKKTSWKNVKKFIKHLDKQLLVKSKDRNGQETVILDVDFNDHRVEQFTPYRLPSKNTVENSGKPVSGKNKAPEDGDDPSVGQTLNVQVLYRPTSKLTPTMFPSDAKAFYKQSDISTHIDNYLTSQDPPLVSEQNKRIVKLDPFLANTVFSSPSADDRATLSRGEVTRDGLLKRILHDSSLCAPYHAILLKPGQTIADVKPKAGPPPKVTTVLERRTGNKTVTKVSGIEIFGIVPTLLAEELQKKCASSTSVAQATGAVKGVMEILIQGDQRQAVETALGRRGIKSQWIDVVDKTKKKK